MSEEKASKTRDDLIKLSRTVSHALRHAPEEYDLLLDSSGWVEISILLSALKKNNSRWNDLSRDDLDLMAAAGEKQRYEITDSHIRAIYGHSVSTPIEYEEKEPPDALYHGTTNEFAELILEQGLKSMKRQYVHLSADVSTALQVALRRTSKPIFLKIDANAAFRDGIKFYKVDNNVWLAKVIDKKYIKGYVPESNHL